MITFERPSGQLGEGDAIMSGPFPRPQSKLPRQANLPLILGKRRIEDMRESVDVIELRLDFALIQIESPLQAFAACISR